MEGKECGDGDKIDSNSMLISSNQSEQNPSPISTCWNIKRKGNSILNENF